MLPDGLKLHITLYYVGNSAFAFARSCLDSIIIRMGLIAYLGRLGSSVAQKKPMAVKDMECNVNKRVGYTTGRIEKQTKLIKTTEGSQGSEKVLRDHASLPPLFDCDLTTK